MNAFLILATLAVAFFVALFGAGAVIGVFRLVASGLPALRVAGKVQDVKADLAVSRPAARAAAATEPARPAMGVELGPVPAMA